MEAAKKRGFEFNDETLDATLQFINWIGTERGLMAMLEFSLADVTRFAHLANKHFPGVADAVERFREEVDAEMEAGKAPAAVEAEGP